MTPSPHPVAPGNERSLPATASAAPTPASKGVGGFPMGEARERELLRAVPRLHCAGEIEGFRMWLNTTGEKPTGAVEAALVRQAGRVR